jgi:hypothetical protein
MVPPFFDKIIKGTFELSDAFRYEMEIYCGGFYGGVPQKPFDGVNIRSMGQQMSCKSVPQ